MEKAFPFFHCLQGNLMIHTQRDMLQIITSQKSIQEILFLLSKDFMSSEIFFFKAITKNYTQEKFEKDMFKSINKAE